MSDKIRGSSNVPLSSYGRSQALDLGARLRGQIDNIYTSDLDRTKDTAAAVAATNPQANIRAITSDLHPWRLGAIEGQPTEKVLPEMMDKIANHPDDIAQGQGPQSTMPGESFNQYKSRILGAVRHIMAATPPGKTTLVSTHYRPIRTVHSWLRTGTPDDSIDTSEMLQKGDSKPGDLFYINPEKMELEKVVNAARPGVYLARHGATAWNAEDQSNSGSNAS